nr:MAG TPA: hypothetical protein [Caudoviricetes sp.]
MGGRGAKSSLSTTAGGAPVQPKADDKIKVDNTQVASNFSANYNKFMSMSDDEKADVISASINQGIPAHLANNDFQRFIYNGGFNEKPDIVDDDTLDKMTGTEIFRTVNSVYDKQNDLSYTGEQIAKQIQSARYTRVSDTGGSLYGRGIYFADSYSGCASYGNTSGNIKKTAVVRGKLNNSAKVVDYYVARLEASKEIASGSKLGKALQKSDRESQVSIYAMSKGYNVISSGHGYMNVLNRKAITLSSDIKPKSSRWK